MENTSSPHLYTKIRPTLALFYFFYSQLLVSAVAGDSTSYTAVENIFLACGSPDKSVFQDGRNLTGDINSEYFSSLQAQNNKSTFSDSPVQPGRSLEKFYWKTRFSYAPFTYIFNITPGQKFIRLYFFATSYPIFDSSKDFFSVQANSFTLLKNFSASLTAAADPDGRETVSKEYCINVEEDGLNITFTPSPDHKQAYAFINGIEIVSMPPNLYYTKTEGINRPFKFLGQEMNPFSIETSNALETVYRINVAGKQIPPIEDTGMYRNWIVDDHYLRDARSGVEVVNVTISLRFDAIRNYTAPVAVYQTAMSMGKDKNVNQNYRLTWEFPVDSGFAYFVRLHFCEVQIEITDNSRRRFEIYIANQTAETRADIFEWSGGNGIPVYSQYAVMMAAKGDEKKQNLSIALHPAPIWMTNYSDAILNGIRITNQTAETRADIFEWSGGNGIPVYSQYAVMMAAKGDEKKQNLSIALHPAPIWMTNYSDAILNGLEIFKVDSLKNLAGPNPDPIPSLSVPRTNPQSTKPKNKSRMIIAIVAGVASGFVVLSLLLLLIFRRARQVKDWGSSTAGTSFWAPFSNSTTKSTKSRGSSLPSDLCTYLSLSEIKAATNNFDVVFIIGVGGFGNVYMGYINDGSTPVAIKRLNLGSQQGALEFNAEIDLLSRLRHLHLVSLIGYCNDHGEMILVYDYMSRGTLRDHLYNSDNPPLPWNQRLEICIVLCARAPILRTVDKKQVSLAVWARQCYCNETVHEIIDPFLKDKIAPECLKKFAEVAMSCLDDNGTRRPSMSDVVWGLEFALQLQETTEKHEKFGDDKEDRKKGEVDDEEIRLMKYESDVDSGSLFSSIGEHVLDSKSASTVTLSTSDDQSFFTKSSGSRHVSGAVFSEIMNPQGR
ncbi:hypothetical protein Patl1_21679 [Pistacia atlantica]|uniref:Uncharacterized protein n=1 Tax=Pistacia atlantica TaxID=434234 RepID=A0ACC1BNC7_9ROSI|nr:hypothetical protein Patl1_21679 [Pistacia atlantica]